jgi:hypothetical protein
VVVGCEQEAAAAESAFKKTLAFLSNAYIFFFGRFLHSNIFLWCSHPHGSCS